MDLQRLVHEDMKAHFAAYPQHWGLTRTDRNIDHRRVPNLRRYFKRRGYALPAPPTTPKPTTPATWSPAPSRPTCPTS